MNNAVANRIKMERRIVRSAINELKAQGFVFRLVADGEGLCDRTDNVATIMRAVCSCDEETLNVYKLGEVKRFGFLEFVYGNDGWDVIADGTVNVDDLIPNTKALAMSLETC